MHARSRALAALLAALAAASFCGSAAQADDTIPPEPPVGTRFPSLPSPPPETVLPTDGVGVQHVCIGRTDAPHNSTHYPGFALVSAVTDCPGVPVSVVVDLYVERVGSWVFLDRGTANGISTIRNNARWRCPSGSTNTFKGIGYHTATGHTIGTSSYVRSFTCR
jgi:hypothetical protein